MNFNFPFRKQLVSIRSFRILLLMIGVIIVAFNDTFGKIEGFVEFLSIYFILVLVALFQWLFVNIRMLINLKNEKAKTELMRLQSQVNPHFFFNMLNNLYGLIDKDSEKAKELILKLSDMMRYSIYEGQKEQVTLKAEIDFIRNFIDLHRMRYHRDMSIDFEVDIDDEQAKVMPLLFIILVENAFKHGVEVLRNHVFVKISMKSQQGRVEFNIENNFDEDHKTEKGIGLENLNKRLVLVYPKKHQLTHEKHKGVYKANLTLFI